MAGLFWDTAHCLQAGLVVVTSYHALMLLWVEGEC